MSISQTQIVDILYKKLSGVSKTDTSTAKSPANESNASPQLSPGSTIWQQDYAIPNVTTLPSSNSSAVTVYSGSTSSVVQAVSLSEGIANETWATNLTNWISPQFGAGYQIKLYAGPTGANASTAITYTNLPVGGSGNNDSWYFDYMAGIVNFADTNVPTAVTGNVVYVVGARYTGPTGIQNFPGNITVGNVSSTFYGNVYSDYIFPQSTANIHLVPNATGIVAINSTTSLGVPYGSESQRPSAALVGQIRYNTTLGSLEFSTGTDWMPLTNSLDDQTIDYADGVTQTFTLSQASTASALLVSINGTIQNPSGANPAYTVSGTQITFAEAPLPTDIIDIRFIAGTTVPELSAFSGNIGTAANKQIVFGNGLTYGYNYAPTLIDSAAIINIGTTPTIIDSFSSTAYRSGKYVVSVSNTTSSQYQASEIIVVQDGTTAKISVYGTTYTGANSLMTFSANIVSGNVVIYGTGASSNNNVNLTKTLISV